MTEAEWLSSTDSTPMLEFLRGKPSARKLRLFAVRCCHALWGDIGDERSKVAVEIAEKHAEGLATLDELVAAHAAHERTFGRHTHDGIYYAIEAATEHPAGFDPHYILASEFPSLIGEERRWQASVLRDIFNPFHTITLDPSWLTSTVTTLARTMYDTRDFSAMPILADALQDSGCEDTQVLSHCRGPGPHVRGCWVCDLCLNKS